MTVTSDLYFSSFTECGEGSYPMGTQGLLVSRDFIRLGDNRCHLVLFPDGTARVLNTNLCRPFHANPPP